MAKPIESQSCGIKQDNTVEAVSDVNSNAKPGRFSGITGAVIGALGPTGTAVVIALIILLVVGLIIVSRKKKVVAPQKRKKK
jgi:hypothetical protein